MSSKMKDINKEISKLTKERAILILNKSINEDWEECKVDWETYEDGISKKYTLWTDTKNKGNSIYDGIPSGHLVSETKGIDEKGTLETHLFKNREELNIWIKKQIDNMIDKK